MCKVLKISTCLTVNYICAVPHCFFSNMLPSDLIEKPFKILAIMGWD